MKEPLTPEKIQKEYTSGEISKENAAELLISLIETSENNEIRVKSIKAIEKIDYQSEMIFKTLENHLISDDIAKVRATAAEVLIQNFLNDSLPALSWVIQHEKSPLVLKLIYDLSEDFSSPEIELIKKDLIHWSEDFSSKIGIVPKESKFFLDLETLFSDDKRNYEIDPLSYKHFETLSDIKNGEPWLVIRNKHVEILNFEYFKWKFIKNNTDIINSLSKLQDLDVYLCSLRNYSNDKFLISGIPKSIGSLTYLKKLILRRNGLKELPTSMRNLTLIKELDISYNKFDEISPVISTLNKLEILNIKHNFIHKIPAPLSNNVKVIR